MKIGIGSYTYPWNVRAGLSAERILDTAVDHGCDVIQLCDNLNLPELDWDVLSGMARDSGIEVQVGGVGGPEELSEVIRFARICGSSIVRFVVGQAFVAQSIAEVADGLKQGARECEEFGARLAIENHDFFTTKQVSDIVAAIGHGAGVCLDTANSLSNLEGTQSLIDNLGEQTICLHAKDVIVEREIHMYGFRIFGVPAGRGYVDFPALKVALPQLTTIILEQWVPTRNGQPPLESELENAPVGLAYLKNLWAN